MSVTVAVAVPNISSLIPVLILVVVLFLLHRPNFNWKHPLTLYTVPEIFLLKLQKPVNNSSSLYLYFYSYNIREKIEIRLDIKHFIT